MKGRLLTYCPSERAAIEVAAACAAIAGSFDAVTLDSSDPFKDLDAGSAPHLLVVDLEADPTLALALCRVARLRFPHASIVGLIGENRLAAGIAMREAHIDAICPHGFDAATLGAFFERHLELGRRRAASTAGPTNHATPHESGSDTDALRLFVQSLAHEVNNPLTTIRGLLQLLQHDDGRLQVSELRGALETMDSESRRISEIVTELEYFGGARKPVRTPISPRAVVREALDSVALHQVEPSEATPIPEVLLDREQFFLALRHLFGYLAAGQNGRAQQMEVSLAAPRGMIVVTIGGPPDSRLRTTTHPLVPLHGSRVVGTDRRSLACAFGIARAHGGTLTIDAKKDGGVAIRFELPAPPTR